MRELEIDLLELDLSVTISEIVKAFEKKQDLSFDYWIDDNITGVAEFSGYCFNLSEICHDLFTNQPKGQIVEWQDHLSDLFDLGKVDSDFISYNSYCMGGRCSDNK